MGYWTYYLIWIAASYFLRYPQLLVGVALFFALRRFIPDPVVWMQTASRISSLRRDVAANPANVTARRDLASIYLQRLRPRTASRLIEEALTREPKNAELLYLQGLARYKAGDAAGAIGPLVEAVQIDARVRFGEPYLVAGDALAKLGRWEEAEDAYERYTNANSSSVQGLTKLARAQRERGAKDVALTTLQNATQTWAHLPGYMKRKELGWWLRAHAARLFA